MMLTMGVSRTMLPALGATAPDFSVLTLAGDRYRLSDHLGEVVFIKLFNFG